MNPDTFRNSTAGQVFHVGQGEAAYWAFVPNPLPPDLTFDAELVRALSEADRALGELAGLGRTLSNPNILIQPFIRREAVLSSRIEGTQASLADVYAYEAQLSHKIIPPNSDVREVVNYVRALEYGLHRLETLPLSLRLLREMHSRLMEGIHGEAAQPGEFRHTQNWIGRPGCTLAEATFVPPPPTEMLTALNAFEHYLHSEDAYPPLLRLVFIHYQFEAIHPFIDGNGRIGRLLLTLLLVKRNLLPTPLLYLSAYFEHHREAYYAHLLAVSQRGAWRDWALFCLRGMSEQAHDANLRAKRLQDLQTQWRRKFQKSRSAGLLLGIIDQLFEQPYITATLVQNQFNVTHQTAMKALRQLEAQKIIVEETGQERNRIYVVEPILDIVQ